MLDFRRCKRYAEAFCGDERGTELIEWVLLTVIVGLAGYTILASIPEQLSDVFEHVLRRFVR